MTFYDPLPLKRIQEITNEEYPNIRELQKNAEKLSIQEINICISFWKECEKQRKQTLKTKRSNNVQLTKELHNQHERSANELMPGCFNASIQYDKFELKRTSEMVIFWKNILENRLA